MKRLIGFMDMCIVTNRGCNLACTHCFIEPELLRSKEIMEESTFKLIYQRAKEVFRLCGHVDTLSLEILGGEISRMPYEFWEKMLPFAIDQHKEFSDEFGTFAELHWCTNMIIQDRRYIDLFNNNKHLKWWEVYSSWEPDTGRFGKNDKLYPRFIKTSSEVKKRKVLNLVPSKGLIAEPFDTVLGVMRDGGYSDISSNMLFPYGSGEAFFNKNQPTFEEVSDFYIHMSREINKTDDMTASPWEEVLGCLVAGEGFNLNGNNVFDATVEPDGTVSMSSTMTGSQSLAPAKTLHVSDPLWALKLVFENAKAMHVRFNLEQKECDQCEFLRYCNGGYYYYKHLTEDVMSKYDQDDCSGYKKFWNWAADELKDRRYSIAEKNHNDVRKLLREYRLDSVKPLINSVRESDLCDDYQGYFDALSKMDFSTTLFIIDKSNLFSISVIERLWFYDSIGARVQIEDCVVDNMSLDHAYRISRNIIAGNYKSVSIDHDFVWGFVSAHPLNSLSKRIIESIKITHNYSPVMGSGSSSPSITPSGLVVDERNDELFRFVLNSAIPDNFMAEASQMNSIDINSFSSDYIGKIIKYTMLERSMMLAKGILKLK